MANPKADYVRRQEVNDPNHTCHWPGCDKIVPPAMWGCRKHWFKLPRALRSEIWRTYQPGQEISKSPSAAYLETAQKVQAWIRDNAAPAGGERSCRGCGVKHPESFQHADGTPCYWVEPDLCSQCNARQMAD